MTVHVSPTGGMNPADFTVQLDSVVNMGTGWYPYSYDLTDYVGTEVRMAIVYRGEWGYALNVDDIAGPEIIQEAGDGVFMPSGHWHYNTYLSGGISVAFRKLAVTPKGLLKGIRFMTVTMPFDKTMNKILGNNWFKRNSPSVVIHAAAKVGGI